jgi:hypothetical protein
MQDAEAVFRSCRDIMESEKLAFIGWKNISPLEWFISCVPVDGITQAIFEYRWILVVDRIQRKCKCTLFADEDVSETFILYNGSELVSRVKEFSGFVFGACQFSRVPYALKAVNDIGTHISYFGVEGLKVSVSDDHMKLEVGSPPENMILLVFFILDRSDDRSNYFLVYIMRGMRAHAVKIYDAASVVRQLVREMTPPMVRS